MIKIVGLGPGDKESLTMGTIDCLKQCKNIFFRTEKHPTVDYIKDLGINFHCYDDEYESKESFDQVYQSIARDLICREKKLGDIVYAVPGHPMVAEKSVRLLIDICTAENIKYSILPAVSFLEAMMQALHIDPVQGLRVIDAFEARNCKLSNKEAVVITQVYNKFMASEVKLALCEYYQEEEEIYFVRAAGIKDEESIRKIKIYELDRQDDIDYLTSLYIPAGIKAYGDFYELVSIVKKLRQPDGCPWDKEQDHFTIKKNLLEECYELIEAIENRDEESLIEELGDVLFQVVFHSQIGSDDGYFNIYDVTDRICRKMIERHPHVFSNLSLDSTEKVLDNWDSIKKQEQGLKTYTDELNHVAKTLPALMRAEKVQKKAAKVGFDWNCVEPALEKVKEEFYELLQVYNCENMSRILDEVGDLLFSVVNVCRFLNIDAEEALSHTTDKFIKRFSFIEDAAREKNIDMKSMTLEQMDELWEEAKK
ncbi:tetrapyrrole methylase family protein / MazG family protein [Hathewaya proteolytica DSM 3090]|uniref:Tetrapyrrole methylase family protein / MazG family protein n=1 Tax=Hathewaya proteolytica DSM 3090 TaxID=1121331 RepID=A0A1M6M9V3_9CLOT|nr:nucleoside triphosphate pyrophosphohydrolase [Hathewaya proteolytica]SHJ80221.1 tetrapyrrole methylase family protein / MazG family protein [Hathewaya proteolytica DSM 3090]